MASIVYDFSVDVKDAVKKWTFKDVKVEMTSETSGRDIKVNYDIDAIEGAIYNMFLFNKGERIIRPDFGNSLYQFLYEPITQITADRIAKEIRNMFEIWEPRVNLTGISVNPNPDQNEYNVVVGYNVPSLSINGLNFEFTANARRR